ncbi:MAG: LAGLIDADG family homing endonuclease, partial [Bacilli bacterium]
MIIINNKSQKELSQRKLETYNKYNKIIQWGRRDPVAFCSRIMGIELLDIQKYAIYNSWFRDFNLWLESRNAGKALALDTKIPTPNGFTTMGEIKVGDVIFNELGKPTKVIYTSPIFYNHKCYEIEFEDGEKIVADEDHLWDVQTKNYRAVKNRIPKTNRKRANYSSLDEYGFKTIATKNLVEDYVLERKDGKGKEYKYRVPKSQAVEYLHKDLIINPYVLGVWLGDGGASDVRITCDNKDLENMCNNLQECGYTTTIYYNKNRTPSIGLNISRHNNRNSFMSSLKELDLINNKHIPQEYLFSSIEQRMELLRGLMDTDGSCDNLGRCEFSQKSYDFILQFSQLLISLGIKHHISKKNIPCNSKICTAYRVYFCVDKTKSCFKLARKYNRLKDKLATRSENKSIISIKEIPSVPTKCIQVDSPRKLYLCGEKNTVTHNTTKLAIYPMIRSLLIPYHVTYYIGNSGDQAKESFKKMEKIAKKEIESFVGSTDVFINELKINGANSDGFTHNPASFKCELFNNSEIYTLNSDIINIKGKRAGLVCYDEAGWFSDELFVQTEQFVNQDENFKLGGGIDISLEPKGFPRQLLYASSASDTDSGFYKKYKQFSERMIMGDPKYFVCDFNVDVVMNATYNGDPYPPLISKDKVDKAMEDNREKAMRELYNKFSADSHEGQILTRRDLMQHTIRRPPLLRNDTGNKLFGFSWDSARLNDNSVIEIAEFIDDPEIGWRMDLHNVVSLVDIKAKKKTPMRIPDQVEKFQSLLLDYNGSDKKKLDYENIKAVICDSGAGGQMVGGVSDYLLKDWIGKDKRLHKGLIDKSHKANETAIHYYRDAIDIMKLIDPKSHRNEIFDSIEKMVKLGVVTFPEDYDGKDSILHIDDDGNEHEYFLNDEEKLSLVQIELLKTEIITMCKYTDGANITYKYPPDKRNTMHDDRVFAFGLLCWYLAQLRRGQIVT